MLLLSLKRGEVMGYGFGGFRGGEGSELLFFFLLLVVLFCFSGYGYGGCGLKE
jgi:hypothetical protein